MWLSLRGLGILPSAILYTVLSFIVLSHPLSLFGDWSGLLYHLFIFCVTILIQ
ncbi:hypothetical protein BD560DRAFT_418248 [Blakeslea trispora]|nr:hypothetical protein BD560DRAFT_418248 [Blakeslea trispora]